MSDTPALPAIASAPERSAAFPIRLLRAVRTKWRASVHRVKNFARFDPGKFRLVVGGLIVAGSMLAFSQVLSFQEDQAAANILAKPRITLQDLKKEVDANQVSIIRDHVIKTGNFFTGVQHRTFLEMVPLKGPSKVVEQTGALSDELWKELSQSAFAHPVKFEQGHNALRQIPASNLIGSAIFMLCIIGVMIAAQMLMGEVISGYNFRPDRPDDSITLDDVIGYDAEKLEVAEVLTMLDRAKLMGPDYDGPRVPRGLLLSGDPGVGKTMIARAIAGSMKAEFFTCTGADFVEMYVGVGPKRVRALFRQARIARTAVIFIDEIDALGSRDNNNSSSEHHSTINRMLAEMDGINGHGNFLVIGATNHPERLDAALRRPGRFDRVIHMPLPDVDTREGILRKYLEKLTLSDDVDLKALSLRTRGYAGAHLRQVVEEANKLALRERVGQAPVVITQNYLERGQEVALLGVGERRTKGTEAHRVAVHELGHALIGHLFCPNSFVEKVTIIGRGQALGYTLTRPANEALLESEAHMKGDLAMMLGGRAAEQIILKSVSNGASDDLDRANKRARHMVGGLGMGRNFGLRTVIPTQNGEWPELAEHDVKELLDGAYDLALKTIEANREWLLDRTDRLLETTTLSREVMFPADWAPRLPEGVVLPDPYAPESNATAA